MLAMVLLAQLAPCKLQSYNTRPDRFPGCTLYKATMPGFSYLMFVFCYSVLLCRFVVYGLVFSVLC